MYKKNYFKKSLLYIFAILLCFVILFWVMHLWSSDLRIPFDYHWDTLYNAASIKGMIETGWFTSNPFIGAPYGYSSYDFSSNAILDMVFLKLVSLFTHEWAATLNIYFLLTFPLTIVTSLYVLRKLKVSSVPALTGSLLFTFVPYHLLQGVWHINLAAYYSIPFVLLVCFRLFDSELTWKLWQQESGIRKINRTGIENIVFCIIIGSTFIYYPFFSCYFLLLAGIVASISRKKWLPFVYSLALICFIVFLILIYNIPSIVYHVENGANEMVVRSPADSEIWGLKFIQLLLPVPGNSNPFLAALSERYYKVSPMGSVLLSENRSAALGFLGSTGLIFLLIWFFLRWIRPEISSRFEFLQKIDQLSLLNMAAILLGCTGCIGALVAYLFFPEIRTYTRISIFIALFSFTALTLIIDFLIKRTTFSRVTVYFCLAALLFTGINDQVSPKMVPEYAGIKREFQTDESFVKAVEAEYDHEITVFQLPYVPFPEGTPNYRMSDYDLFRGYLHSTKIRWSYGAMKGRYGDYCLSRIAGKKVEEMVRDVSIAGFDGIYIDTYGYRDGGEGLIGSLKTILKIDPIVSENKRLYYFDMTKYNTDLKLSFDPKDYKLEKEKVLYPVYLEFKKGFTPQRGTSAYFWRLCSSRGQISFTNFTDHDIKIIFRANFATGYSEPSKLVITGDIFSDELRFNESGWDYEAELVIPPGKHYIALFCNAKKIDQPEETRKDLVFGIFNYEVKEIE